MPPDFPDWPAFERFFSAMARAGVLRTARDIHWDLRPCPHFGTLEALAALLRALVRFLQASLGSWTPPGVLCAQPWWTLRDNCFIAARDGLEARLIASQDGDLMPVKRIAAGLPYARLRRLLLHSGCLREVVGALAREFRVDLNAPAA